MRRLMAASFVVGALLSATPVTATEVRVNTMGFQPLVIQDDFNIWTFTSAVNDYPKRLFIAHDAGPRVGMITPFMRNAVVGVFFSRNVKYVAFAPHFADQRLDLFYGRRMTGFEFGAHLDWSGRKTEQTGTQSAGALGLDVGVGIPTGGNKVELDGFYRKLDFIWEDLGADTVIQSLDNGAEAGLAARYLWVYNSTLTIIPAVQIVRGKVALASDGRENTQTLVSVVLGFRAVPKPGSEILTSLGTQSTLLRSRNAADSLIIDSKQVQLPYIRIGADIQLKRWLAMRVGATKRIAAADEDKISNVSQANALSSYYLGAGIELGPVHCDVRIRKESLNGGPYLLSGERPDDDLFEQIAFTYDFN